MREHQLAIFYINAEWPQVFSQAGPPFTKASVNPEQGTVGDALNALFSNVEKLICVPVTTPSPEKDTASF